MARPRPIAFYYGDGQLDRLADYRRVVLQPDFYRPTSWPSSAGAGVQPLGVPVALGGPGAAGALAARRPQPGLGRQLRPRRAPGWVEHVVGQAQAALAAGFTGLFLDTLNVELTYPEDVPHLLDLIAAIREEAGDAYLLANRGFGMLPQLAELVDGVLFESFSVRWTEDGYAPWPPDVLEFHAEIAERLLELDLDLYALDYADSEGLAAFATRRARQFGLQLFISDRALSRV